MGPRTTYLAEPAPVGRKKSFLRKSYVLLSIFVIGLLHLFLARRVARPSIELTFALAKNEFFDKPPTKIVVLGELRSGAEYAAEVLRRAYGDDVVASHDRVVRPDLLDGDELRAVAGRTDVLWILVVRSPCEWADAVVEHRKEACERREMPRSQCGWREFASDADHYRIPWHDVPVAGNGTGVVDDRNIVKSKQRQKFEYGDIFDMRGQKLLLMKQIVEQVPRHAKILRLREFELNPDVFVNDLHIEYRFDLRPDYEAVPPSPRATNPPATKSAASFSCMDHPKWKEARQRIDWTLEGYFGHHAFDCRLCRGSGLHAGGGTTSGRSPIESPSRMYVLGERNSGTTFASNTLSRAFDPPERIGDEHENFSSDIPVLLYKHMFRHDLLSEEELAEIKARDDILWIMVVRSPCDWAEGMFRKPYHLCPPKHPERCGPGSDPHEKVWLNQNSVTGITFSHFFAEFEWNDWAESVPFLRAVKSGQGGDGSEVSLSKVSANYTYPNVFALRRHKLRIMKQIAEAVPRNVKFARLKELERGPEAFVRSIAEEFDAKLKDGYEEQPPSKVAHPTVCLTPDEWDAAQKTIDWKTEAEFGFGPLDCRMCYGYDRSKRLYSRIMDGKKTNQAVRESEQRFGSVSGKPAKKRGAAKESERGVGSKSAKAMNKRAGRRRRGAGRQTNCRVKWGRAGRTFGTKRR